MRFAQSVSTRSDNRPLAAPRDARVQLLTRDPFGAFVAAAVRERLQRITIVSPWISDLNGRERSLGDVIGHAEVHDAAVVLITRPAQSEAHALAVARVETMARGTVYLNPRLHAKLYVCEAARTGGLAVVGSANCTDSSASLDEIGVLLRPANGSRVIQQLGNGAVRLMSGGGPPYRLERDER